MRTQSDAQRQADIAGAQSLAQEGGDPKLAPMDCASALLAEPEGVMGGVLAKLGIETEALTAQVAQELAKQPRSSGGELSMSRAMNEVMTDAANTAQAMEDEYISTEHLLLALARKGGSELVAMLSAHGLAPQQIEAALLEVRKGRHVTSPEPESTFEALSKYAQGDGRKVVTEGRS